MTNILDDTFHSAALEAFLQVSRECQGWPPSEAVKRLAYKFYEDELKTKSGDWLSETTERKESPMTPEQIRAHHFERLNNYRNSAEYADYAKTIGADVPQGDLPSLLGHRWEINEEIYDDFLGMLPPLGWRGNSFFLREFTFGDITAKFTKDGDKFYCEFARYPERRIPVETPWGHPDTVKEIAPGITLYSTPSHGGFHLSDARVASMPKCLREFTPWAGPGWFEEDCDWAVVAAAFPQFFPPDAIEAAMRTLKCYKPEVFAEMEKGVVGRGAG